MTLDHGYTAGIGSAAASSAESPGTHPLGGPFWLHGTLMDRETYFGEQYLFFGYPQLYVDQVKAGLFWPSQLKRMRSRGPKSVAVLTPLPFEQVQHIIGHECNV